MYKKILLLFSVSICLFSCNDTKSVNTDFADADIMVELLPEDSEFVFSDNYSFADTLALSGCDISSIRSLIPYDGGLIIVGKILFPECNYTDYVALFDNDGRYVRSLVKRGNGPKEMLNIVSVKLNGEILEVLGNYGCVLNNYDIKSGEVIETIDIQGTEIFCAADFCKMDDGSYVFYKNLSYSEDPEYKLYLWNKESGVTRTYLPLDKQLAELVSFDQKVNLWKHGKDVFFYDVFAKGLYKVEKDKLVPYIGFVENSYSMSDDVYNSNYNDLMDFVENCRNSGYVWGNMNMFVSSNHALSEYNVGKHKYLNIIDLNKQKSVSFVKIYDDLCFDTLCNVSSNVYSVLYLTDDKLYIVVDPFLLKEMSRNDKTKVLDENMNPIVLVLHK